MTDCRGYHNRESDDNSSQTDSDSDSSCSSQSSKKEHNTRCDYGDSIERSCKTKGDKICNKIKIKCPVGPLGPTGPMGIAGLTIVGPTGASLTGPSGNTGASGLDGLSITGPTGPVGLSITGASGLDGLSLTGPTGPSGLSLTGPIGPMGFTGPIGDAGGLSGFGYLYNITSQTVQPEDPISFEANLFVTGFIHTAPSPFIVIVNTGLYKVEFSVTGNIPNQFAIFVNGVAQSPTVYGSSIGTQQNNGMAILSLNAGDVVTIVNHTTGSGVTLSTLVGGTQANVNASVIIERLR